MTNSTTGGGQAGTVTGPYSQAARVYRDLGWLGVLPADLNGRIGHVPNGYSGGHDVDPDDDQVLRWIDSHGDHNVALRLPDDIIGIDVDVYGDKHGDRSVEYVADQLQAGELPPTWTSTARGPNQPSRIYLYRVPAGTRWRSDLGRGSCVEVIRRGHRWARVWPSTNHRLLGRIGADPIYRWYAPDGGASVVPPRVDQLAELPSGWVDVLRLADDGTDAPRVPSGDVGGSGSHSADDAPVVDVDGQPVDPRAILEQGIPIGSQQNELFRYMCSLRARNMRREEMLVLGMVALQRMENDPERESWTPNDITVIVDHVRREYGPGGAATLSRAEREFIERVRTGESLGITVDEPPLTDVSATDLGNSLRFVKLFKDRARYAADVDRWFVWDGQRWAPDRVGRVFDMTKYVIDDLRRQAFEDTEHRDEWVRWANLSEAIGRRRAMVEGAQSEPELVVMSDTFDRDENLLVVRNGTIDLRTGELRRSDPADLCSQLAEVDFDADARHDLWSAHVNLVCKGDPELTSYLARAIGYSLTGNVGARAFFFLEGTGSNGKNAFIEPIMQVMGSYAQTATPALLTGGESDHPTAIADLLGARLVFIDETRKDKPLNAERIKALTGSKRIKARHMRQDFFEFDARFKLWIAGNGTPKMKDDSDGVWKRLHRVICHGKVSDAQRKDRYGDVLYRDEASGILNWAIAGLLDWRQRGLAVPTSIVADVDEYRHDENYERQFVEEYLEVTGDQDHRMTNESLWMTYSYWCASNGIRGNDVKIAAVLSKSIVSLELDGVERFIGRIDGRVQRGFSGLRPVRRA